MLEKTYGLADTATTVGDKSAEVMRREARLPEATRQQLSALYREEGLRLALLYTSLGLALCRTLEPELDDDAARTQMDFFRVRFQALYENAQADLEKEFAGSKALLIEEL